MTTRQDILKEFRISPRGTIQNPGKFEGEMLYAPYFYDVIMEGCGGDEFYLPQEERVYTVIVPTAEDKAEFHQLEDVIGVICFETDQGFFNVETYTVGQEKTFNLAVEELAELSEAEVEEE